MKLQELYYSRCKKTESGYKPLFWQAQPVKYSSPSLFGSDSDKLDDYGVQPTIARILSLNLELELPVGEFVSDACKRDLPDNPVVRPLLKSNIADEARHFEGFQAAVGTYQPSPEYMQQAIVYREAWESAFHYDHPLFAPMVLEVGLFLAALGFLRVCAGKHLATLAAKVSEDEYRHVLSNRTILQMLGYNAFQPNAIQRDLLDETVSWVFQDLKLPSSYLGDSWNVDYMLATSRDLLLTGEAKSFNEIVFICDYEMPFENQNSTMYTRG